MQTLPFKVAYIFLSFISCISLSVDAQVIRFTLDLPTSFEVNDNGAPPMILEPITDNTQIVNKTSLRWIEIRSSENIELIIELKTDQKFGPLSGKSYFLNDGSTNFAAATEIPPGGGAYHLEKINK